MRNLLRNAFDFVFTLAGLAAGTESGRHFYHRYASSFPNLASWPNEVNLLALTLAALDGYVITIAVFWLRDRLNS